MDYNITYRQKDKGWQYIISYKINGSWKQKSKQGFKTKKEAKPYADKMLSEIKLNIKNDSLIIDLNFDSINFKELSDLYISHFEIYNEYNTIKGYKNAISKFKDLNNIKVKNIKKLNIQNCVDGFIKEKLKTSTINTYLRRIKQVFDYYKNNYNLSYNINLDVIVPKDVNKKEKKALSREELNKLLGDLKCYKFYINALIAATCGLRSGEILGLTWNDINFEDSTMNVDKQWKVDKKSKSSNFGTLKSKNSYRVVPIPMSTLKELKKYKKKSITDIYNRVTPFNKASIEKYLNPKLQELAGVSIHELRHTYATRLIYNGIDFKTTARILGHSVEQTLKTYSHVNDEMMNNATKVIKQIF